MYTAFFVAFFYLTAIIRLGCFTLSGWLLARFFPAHRYVGVAALILTATMWRFVPWRIAPVYELSPVTLGVPPAQDGEPRS